MRGDRLDDAARSLPSAPAAPVGEGIEVVVCAADDPAPQGARWTPGRRALAGLDPATQAVALRCVAVANWRRQSHFCPRCGAAVEVAPGGAGWRCSRDAAAVFPRTDPCVITAVLDDAGRLLLSHASNHADGVYTLVAGFVEAGEALEDAVRREALEEVGVALTAMRYLGSQPWPFPASLMTSWVALAQSTSLRVDGEEILDARWFTRAELAKAEAAGWLTLPMPYSVARKTVEAWRAGTLVW
jgi:NAD+ diphosphatase